MTPSQFRRLALALPEATEGAHGGHPDFRVGGKVFASLGYPDATFGMVKLAPDQQAMLVEGTPTVFAPIANAWGLKGYTNVRLAAVDAATLEHALTLAWENTAAKKLKAGQRPAFSRKSSKTESPARKTSRKTKARA